MVGTHVILEETPTNSNIVHWSTIYHDKYGSPQGVNAIHTIVPCKLWHMSVE